MGDILDGLKAMVIAPLKERKAREILAQAEIRQAEQITDMLGEAAKLVQPENDGFVLVGSDLRDSMSTKPELMDLRLQSFNASYRSPIISGILTSLIRFVIGKGVTLTANTDDDSLNMRLNETWKEWSSAVKFKWTFAEIAWRLWRDGEVFIKRTFPEDETINYDTLQKQTLMKMNVSAEDLDVPEPASFITISLIDPGNIKDPTGAFSEGIMTHPDDVSRVVGYVFCTDDIGVNLSFIPAADVIHVKIRVDANVKRGRSLLEPILRYNKRYEQWLDYRMVLSKIRTAVALIKKIKGTPTQRQAIRDSTKSQRPDRDVVRGEDRQQVLRAGTIVHSHDGIEWDMQSPNLQAADAQHDGREIKLSIAAAMNLPEYMVTGDASNANFSSTMVAEGPAVREFEYWQEFLKDPLMEIWQWVMDAYIDRGLLQLPPGGINTDDVEIKWPPLVARDELKTTQANAIKHERGIKSRTTWQEEDGLDPEMEAMRVDQERQADMEFGIDNEPDEDEA